MKDKFVNEGLRNISKSFMKENDIDDKVKEELKKNKAKNKK